MTCPKENIGGIKFEDVRRLCYNQNKRSPYLQRIKPCFNICDKGTIRCCLTMEDGVYLSCINGELEFAYMLYYLRYVGGISMGSANEMVELILTYLSFISHKTEISPTLDIYELCKQLERHGYITENEWFQPGK